MLDESDVVYVAPRTPVAKHHAASGTTLSAAGVIADLCLLYTASYRRRACVSPGDVGIRHAEHNKMDRKNVKTFPLRGRMGHGGGQILFFIASFLHRVLSSLPTGRLDLRP